MRRSRQVRQGDEPGTRIEQTSLLRQLGLRGAIAFRGGPCLILLKKTTATCELPGEGLEPLSLLDPSMVMLVGWLVLLFYVPSQQLWSLRDGQFT